MGLYNSAIVNDAMNRGSSEADDHDTGRDGATLAIKVISHYE
jgi:hypothetical protein